MTLKDNLGCEMTQVVILGRNGTSMCIADNHLLDYESVCSVWNM